VAGRHLHAAGGAEVADREVVHRRGDEADAHHVEAGLEQPLDQIPLERHARRPHVATHHDRLAGAEIALVEDGGKGEPDGFRLRLVDLARIDATDVVGLEDPRHVRPARS
jgi:hypothetical protein